MTARPETSIEEHAVMSLRNAARYEWRISMFIYIYA